MEGRVIGHGKLIFYSAPNAQCQIKELLAEPGSSVTVYKPYKRWVNVMFIAKNGDDFVGWVPSNRVKVVG